MYSYNIYNQMPNIRKYFTTEDIKEANKLKRMRYIEKLGGLEVFKASQRARAKKNYAENYHDVKTKQQIDYFIKTLFK